MHSDDFSGNRGSSSGSSDDDDDDDCVDDGGKGNDDHSFDDDDGGISALRAQAKSKGLRSPGAVQIKVGHFAFIPAEEFLFLAGKVVDVRWANYADKGAKLDEVQLHRWSFQQEHP